MVSCLGRSWIRRSAISRASSSGRKTLGSSAISRASCSTASRLLSNDSRPASCHGSRPRRVRAEITLNGIPSISSPTVANRNLSRSVRNGWKDRRKLIAEALERGQQGPVLGSWSSTPSPRTAAPKEWINVPLPRDQLAAEMPLVPQMGPIFNFTTDFNRVTKQDVTEVNLSPLRESSEKVLCYLHQFSRSLSWIRDCRVEKTAASFAPLP